MRLRAHPIWSIDLATFSQAIASSSSFSEAVRKLGFFPGCHLTNSLKTRAREDGINTDHIPTGYNSSSGKGGCKRATRPLSYYLRKNSTVTRAVIKKLVIREKLLEYKCVGCGNAGVWNGKSLVLILDHENGVNNDHELHNLRFLCPNCNAQTSTFSGRNVKYRTPKKLRVSDVNPLWRHRPQPRRQKVPRPEKSVFLSDLKEKSYAGMASKYAVSPTTIRKWMVAYGLPDRKCDVFPDHFNPATAQPLGGGKTC
jgi:5-methylcytosine-specific restriction endonuclease McrA